MEKASMGELIRHYRKQRGISQERLAGEICTRRQLLNIENGKNVPSLELVYRFSESLNVDLLETYNTALKHNGLNTHLKYMEIDSAIRTKDDDLLEVLVHDCEHREGFQSGEPLQMILHAKSILIANAGDFCEAQNLTLRSIQVTHKDYLPSDNLTGSYSVAEIGLMIAYAIYTCLLNQRQDGIKILDNVEKYIKSIIFNAAYIFEHQKPIWINLWCVAIYNEFSFSTSAGNEILMKINDVVDYQKKNDRIYMLVELLLCRAAILMENGEKQVAEADYQRAKVLGEFYRSANYFSKLAQKIINLHSNICKFDVSFPEDSF
ncbi:MAG: helix-turn-helix domain-containing protein [Acetatifactor sp.]|nr:helix-turn-helix domain-containing protein [Acetatifactor sp.]